MPADQGRPYGDRETRSACLARGSRAGIVSPCLPAHVVSRMPAGCSMAEEARSSPVGTGVRPWVRAGRQPLREGCLLQAPPSPRGPTQSPPALLGLGRAQDAASTKAVWGDSHLKPPGQPCSLARGLWQPGGKAAFIFARSPGPMHLPGGAPCSDAHESSPRAGSVLAQLARATPRPPWKHLLVVMFLLG